MDIKNLKFSAEEIDSLLTKIKNLDLSNIEANANIDLAIGQVETVENIENASASIVKNGDSYRLNLSIPKGGKGDKGNDGASPSFSIGTTTMGTKAKVTITGDFPNYILNFVLPSTNATVNGLTEEQEQAIAKINTIESNVNSMKNSKIDAVSYNGETMTFKANNSTIQTMSIPVADLQTRVATIESNGSIAKGTPSGNVEKTYVIIDKSTKTKYHYITMSFTEAETVSAYEDLASGEGSNYNGAYWCPFYHSVNSSKVIGANVQIIDVNKWGYKNFGAWKYGGTFIGSIGNNGCYVFIEDTQHVASGGISLKFIVTIIEDIS
mgnify:FL=1